MNGAGDCFFARAAFTGNQDIRIGFCNSLYDFEQLVHRRTIADNFTKTISIDIGRNCTPCYPCLILMCQRTPNARKQVIDLHRFKQIVGNAKAHTFNRRRQGRRAGYHNQRDVRPLRTSILEQLQLKVPGHVKVRQHEIELLIRQRFQCGCTARRARAYKSLPAQ